jgi:hypothetical protein
LSPAFDVRPVGAGGGGTPAGVALVSFDNALETPPTEAVTLKKYVVPLVRPMLVNVALVSPPATATLASPFDVVPRKML